MATLAVKRNTGTAGCIGAHEFNTNVLLVCSVNPVRLSWVMVCPCANDDDIRFVIEQLDNVFFTDIRKLLRWPGREDLIVKYHDTAIKGFITRNDTPRCIRGNDVRV